MTPEEKKARIDYLWRKIRTSIKIKGNFKEIAEIGRAEDRDNFGLDSDCSFELPEGQELEEDLHYEDDNVFTDLSWFLINPESKFSMFQNI